MRGEIHALSAGIRPSAAGGEPAGSAEPSPAGAATPGPAHPPAPRAKSLGRRPRPPGDQPPRRPRLPSSTLHDALSPARAALPPLHVVQAIAAACATPAARDEWTSAWRTVRMLEFDRDDPAPREQPPVPARPTLRLIRS